MSKLPPFFVISFNQTNLLDDTGDDMVFFDVELEVNEQLYNCLVPFYILIKYFKKNKPTDAGYFTKLRSSIAGFGPKETVVLRLAQEEGYDIEKEVIDFIAAETTIEKLTPLDKKQTGIEHRALQEQANKLQTLAQENKSFNLRNIAFTDVIIDLLNKKILEVYPEIFNSRPEFIIELKELLINQVLHLGYEVNNLAWKAYNNE